MKQKKLNTQKDGQTGNRMRKSAICNDNSLIYEDDIQVKIVNLKDD